MCQDTTEYVKTFISSFMWSNVLQVTKKFDNPSIYSIPFNFRKCFKKMPTPLLKNLKNQSFKKQQMQLKKKNRTLKISRAVNNCFFAEKLVSFYRKWGKGPTRVYFFKNSLLSQRWVSRRDGSLAEILYRSVALTPLNRCFTLFTSEHSLREHFIQKKKTSLGKWGSVLKRSHPTCKILKSKGSGAEISQGCGAGALQLFRAWGPYPTSCTISKRRPCFFFKSGSGALQCGAPDPLLKKAFRGPYPQPLHSLREHLKKSGAPAPLHGTPTPHPCEISTPHPCEISTPHPCEISTPQSFKKQSFKNVNKSGVPTPLQSFKNVNVVGQGPYKNLKKKTSTPLLTVVHYLVHNQKNLKNQSFKNHRRGPKIFIQEIFNKSYKITLKKKEKAISNIHQRIITTLEKKQSRLVQNLQRLMKNNLFLFKYLLFYFIKKNYSYFDKTKQKALFPILQYMQFFIPKKKFLNFTNGGPSPLPVRPLVIFKNVPGGHLLKWGRNLSGVWGRGPTIGSVPVGTEVGWQPYYPKKKKQLLLNYKYYTSFFDATIFLSLINRYKLFLITIQTQKLNSFFYPFSLKKNSNLHSFYKFIRSTSLFFKQEKQIFKQIRTLFSQNKHPVWIYTNDLLTSLFDFPLSRRKKEAFEGREPQTLLKRSSFLNLKKRTRSGTGALRLRSFPIVGPLSHKVGHLPLFKRCLPHTPKRLQPHTPERFLPHTPVRFLPHNLLKNNLLKIKGTFKKQSLHLKMGQGPHSLKGCRAPAPLVKFKNPTSQPKDITLLLNNLDFFSIQKKNQLKKKLYWHEIYQMTFGITVALPLNFLCFDVNRFSVKRKQISIGGRAFALQPLGFLNMAFLTMQRSLFFNRFSDPAPSLFDFPLSGRKKREYLNFKKIPSIEEDPKKTSFLILDPYPISNFKKMPTRDPSILLKKFQNNPKKNPMFFKRLFFKRLWGRGPTMWGRNLTGVWGRNLTGVGGRNLSVVWGRGPTRKISYSNFSFDNSYFSKKYTIYNILACLEQFLKILSNFFKNLSFFNQEQASFQHCGALPPHYGAPAPHYGAPSPQSFKKQRKSFLNSRTSVFLLPQPLDFLKLQESGDQNKSGTFIPIKRCLPKNCTIGALQPLEVGQGPLDFLNIPVGKEGIFLKKNLKNVGLGTGMEAPLLFPASPILKSETLTPFPTSRQKKAFGGSYPQTLLKNSRAPTPLLKVGGAPTPDNHYLIKKKFLFYKNQLLLTSTNYKLLENLVNSIKIFLNLNLKKVLEVGQGPRASEESSLLKPLLKEVGQGPYKNLKKKTSAPHPCEISTPQSFKKQPLVFLKVPKEVGWTSFNKGRALALQLKKRENPFKMPSLREYLKKFKKLKKSGAPAPLPKIKKHVGRIFLNTALLPSFQRRNLSLEYNRRRVGSQTPSLVDDPLRITILQVLKNSIPKLYCYKNNLLKDYVVGSHLFKTNDTHTKKQLFSLLKKEVFLFSSAKRKTKFKKEKKNLKLCLPLSGKSKDHLKKAEAHHILHINQGFNFYCWRFFFYKTPLALQNNRNKKPKSTNFLLPTKGSGVSALFFFRALIVKFKKDATPLSTSTAIPLLKARTKLSFLNIPVWKAFQKGPHSCLQSLLIFRLAEEKKWEHSLREHLKKSGAPAPLHGAHTPESFKMGQGPKTSFLILGPCKRKPCFLKDCFLKDCGVGALQCGVEISQGCGVEISQGCGVGAPQCVVLTLNLEKLLKKFKKDATPRAIPLVKYENTFVTISDPSVILKKPFLFKNYKQEWGPYPHFKRCLPGLFKNKALLMPYISIPNEIYLGTISASTIKNHQIKIKSIVKQYTNIPVATFLILLNNVIRNFLFFTSNQNDVKKLWNEMNFFLYQLLWKWARRKHNRQNSSWIFQRYWKFKQIRGKSNVCFYSENHFHYYYLLSYKS